MTTHKAKIVAFHGAFYGRIEVKTCSFLMKKMKVVQANDITILKRNFLTSDLAISQDKIGPYSGSKLCMYI